MPFNVTKLAIVRPAIAAKAEWRKVDVFYLSLWQVCLRHMKSGRSMGQLLFQGGTVSRIRQ